MGWSLGTHLLLSSGKLPLAEILCRSSSRVCRLATDAPTDYRINSERREEQRRRAGGDGVECPRSLPEMKSRGKQNVMGTWSERNRLRDFSHTCTLLLSLTLSRQKQTNNPGVGARSFNEEGKLCLRRPTELKRRRLLRSIGFDAYFFLVPFSSE